MKNLTWQNPEPLGFAASRVEELFVAQELIKKVKLECCGIWETIENVQFMKKKQFYEKPSMKVFELKQQPQLLAGSSGSGGTSPYIPQTPDTW